jgi:hypothetical protein
MADKKTPDLDSRVRNFFGHQAMNLKAREAMEKAGVKDKKSLPEADYRFGSARKRIEEGDRQRTKVKKMAKGGSASKRADGCATKGKTKGRFV